MRILYIDKRKCHIPGPLTVAPVPAAKKILAIQTLHSYVSSVAGEVVIMAPIPRYITQNVPLHLTSDAYKELAEAILEGDYSDGTNKRICGLCLQ